jgi:hypothetical protein
MPRYNTFRAMFVHRPELLFKQSTFLRAREGGSGLLDSAHTSRDSDLRRLQIGLA